MKVNMLEAKNRLSELVKAAQAGEEVVIANRGEPVAHLIAVGKHRGVRTKPAEGGIVAWLDAHPLPLASYSSLRQYRRIFIILVNVLTATNS